MKKDYQMRIRPERWTALQKKTLEISSEAKEIIKPTDVADAILAKGTKTINLKDVEKEKNTRKERKAALKKSK